LGCKVFVIYIKAKYYQMLLVHEALFDFSCGG